MFGKILDLLSAKLLCFEQLFIIVNGKNIEKQSGHHVTLVCRFVATKTIKTFSSRWYRQTVRPTF